KIEIDNLKNSIRLWYSSIIHRRPIRHRSEYLFKEVILHPVDWTALINALSWDGVVGAVEHTPYYSILLQHTEDSLREEGLFRMEGRLDQEWYEEIRTATSLLKKTDRQIALDLLDREIDLKNLLILVRYGWYHRLGGEELRPLLLPWGEVFERKEVYRYIETPKESRSAKDLLSSFLPVEHGIDDGSPVEEVLRIEEFLADNRKRAYRRLLGGDPFTIGIALAYFFLNKEEFRRIRAILNGKYYGFDEGYIRGVIG
ncbi:MAG TPA: V-type ATPase subunit, partial [Sphaerochaeta sp.]|nr:V-type ATPase subunit [Sphaerochaeta sp.]